MLCRLILAKWAKETISSLLPALEGIFSDEEIHNYNALGYNIYFLPNYPKEYQKGQTVDGTHIDTFEYVYVDCDLKDGVYTKDTFIEAISLIDIPPTRIVDSGNGIHVYWKVSNLDPMAFLRFQRRLCRLLVTDEAVSKLFQLMRVPGTINTKYKDAQVPCVLLGETDIEYTSEELDKLLPPITMADEAYCKAHYNKTYNIDQEPAMSEDIPPKFGKFLRSSPEAMQLWSDPGDDRSRADFRLAHLLHANGFTKEEAGGVLMNSAKASLRAPIHRQSYANNIIKQIWTYDVAQDSQLELSMSVKEILSRSETSTLKGTRFPCNPLVDNTEHGFRLGQVIGLVAGSGVGKTAFALNMFKWFAENNPDYHHFFIPLEQPPNEIADRWKTLCGENTALHEKVHILSNYAEDGTFRRLSFEEIKDYIKKFQKVKGIKVGCVVIDHIGALKQSGGNSYASLEAICHEMKGFAIETNTLLVMQSQAPREKAGIGDLELNKDAAYGTVYFESYCDYLITLWQPLKRCHNIQECPTITAFKFCKIRHKRAKRDILQEDVTHNLFFDSETEHLRELTEAERKAFKNFLLTANNRRKQAKEGIVDYQSVPKASNEAS